MSNELAQITREPKRNLGGAIFLVAIADYRSTDEETHENAKQFLYPQTREWQDQYDWAVALAEGVNPAWLRDALDRYRSRWDEQRLARMSSRVRRGARSRIPSTKGQPLQRKQTKLCWD